MSTQSILYEQPVNELIRVCLRLEHLLEQVQHGVHGNHIHDTQMAVTVLTQILHIVERPDLRTKFTKEFIRHMSTFNRFLNSEHIDQKKLQATLSELDDTIKYLQTTNGRFVPELRDNEFLFNIRQRLATPGGTCSFDTPAYHYWLQSPLNERQRLLMQWINYFEPLVQIVDLLLRLVRQSGHPQLQTAREGFFQMTFDPQSPCQLIRVAVPNTTIAFPEISVGRHGMSIRFYQPTIKERPALYDEDVVFKLSCCIL